MINYPKSCNTLNYSRKVPEILWPVSCDKKHGEIQRPSYFQSVCAHETREKWFKIWACDEKEDYLNNFEIHTVKNTHKPKTDLGQRVVLDMTKDLEGNGYHSYFDNYFTTTDILLFI